MSADAGRPTWKFRYPGEPDAPIIEVKHFAYSGQQVFVVNVDGYVYLVPFVEDAQAVFLKTIIPSRKATKRYLGEEGQEGQDG